MSVTTNVLLVPWSFPDCLYFNLSLIFSPLLSSFLSSSLLLDRCALGSSKWGEAIRYNRYRIYNNTDVRIWTMSCLLSERCLADRCDRLSSWLLSSLVCALFVDWSICLLYLLAADVSLGTSPHAGWTHSWASVIPFDWCSLLCFRSWFCS